MLNDGGTPNFFTIMISALKSNHSPFCLAPISTIAGAKESLPSRYSCFAVSPTVKYPLHELYKAKTYYASIFRTTRIKQ